MNIYEKLNAARLYFQDAGVKMSGRNTFSNYSYFELSDILPIINKAAKEIGFACVVRFGREEATLDFVDAENPAERIVFTSPMAKAELKGCHEAQNLGAAETYVRRYLYLAAFEITEFEALDSAQPAARKESADRKVPPPKAEAPKKAQGGKDEAAMSPAELQEEIQRVLTATHPDGKLVFTEEEKKDWWKRFKKNPSAVVWLAKSELEKRGIAWGADNP